MAAKLADSGQARKMGLFLVVGLPAFAVAFLINYLLVSFAGWPKSPAYALIMVVQLTINYFMCRWFVFDVPDDASPWRQYVAFVSGAGVFRFADWLLYTLFVSLTAAPFLAVQALNTGLFAILKFLFSQRVFEGQRALRTRAPG